MLLPTEEWATWKKGMGSEIGSWPFKLVFWGFGADFCVASFAFQVCFKFLLVVVGVFDKVLQLQRGVLDGFSFFRP